MKMTAVEAIRTVRAHWLSPLIPCLWLLTRQRPANPATGKRASRIAGVRISQPYESQGLRNSGCHWAQVPLWGVGRRRAINSADVSRAHDRARGFHHDAGARQARGREDPERVGHREGQRDPRRNRRLAPLVPSRRLRAHPYLRQEDQGLHDLSRLQRLRREPRALQEVLHASAATATASTGSTSIPTTRRTASSTRRTWKIPASRRRAVRRTRCFRVCRRPATRRPRRSRRRGR